MKRAIVFFLSSLFGLSVLLWAASGDPSYARGSGTATPEMFNSTTPNPAIDPGNGIANGSLDIDDFGLINRWSQTDIDPYHWYLVQDVSPTLQQNTRWVERVDLSQDNRGWGLRSLDSQTCNLSCSTEAVQLVYAEAGRVYTLSADSQTVQGGGGTLYLDFLDANRQRINVVTRGGYGPEWGRQTITAQAPARTEYIRVILYTNNAVQGVVLWDNVMLLSAEIAAAPPTPLAGVAPTLAGQFVPGQQVTAYAVNDTLSVRAGPGVVFTILEKLEPGTVITILEGPWRSDDGLMWWRVRTPREIEGWAVESADGIQTLIP